MKYILFLLFMYPIILLFGQTQIVLSNNHGIQKGGVLVFKNASFTVKGTFAASTGTVEITGTSAAVNTQIGGTGSTTFQNIEIDKSSNDAQLGGDIAIANQLIFSNGNLDVASNTCSINNGGIITGATASKYVKTSGIGTLSQTVSNSSVIFPVGNSAFNPMILNNAGTTDNFHVRVADEVLVNGNSGGVEIGDVVDRTWFVTEDVVGGTNMTMTAQWNGGEELTGFSRDLAILSHYSTNWDTPEFVGASSGDPYTVSRGGLTTLSPFAVREGSIELSIAVSPTSSIENSGDQLFYTFTRSGNYTTGDVTVSFSVSGTATFGVDYTESGAATFTTTSGTLVIPNGSSSATITVTPTGDMNIEANETIILTVLGGS